MLLAIDIGNTHSVIAFTMAEPWLRVGESRLVLSELLTKWGWSSTTCSEGMEPIPSSDSMLRFLRASCLR